MASFKFEPVSELIEDKAEHCFRTSTTIGGDCTPDSREWAHEGRRGIRDGSGRGDAQYGSSADCRGRFLEWQRGSPWTSTRHGDRGECACWCVRYRSAALKRTATW